MLAESKKLFRWGALLAWIPLVVVFLPSVVTMIRAARENKATGLGALAGGSMEGISMLGLLAFVVSELAGITLLFRSVSREHAGRSVGAGVSIGCASLGMVLIAALFLAASLR